MHYLVVVVVVVFSQSMEPTNWMNELGYQRAQCERQSQVLTDQTLVVEQTREVHNYKSHR